MTQLAVYYACASIGVTAAHKICEMLRGVVASTPSTRDDQALAAVERFLGYCDVVLGFFAVRLGKK